MKLGLLCLVAYAGVDGQEWFVWQAIPRNIWLDKSGKQLVQWPILELEKLRTKQVALPNKLIKGGTVLEVSGVTAAQVSFSAHISIRHVDRSHLSHKPTHNSKLFSFKFSITDEYPAFGLWR